MVIERAKVLFIVAQVSGLLAGEDAVKDHLAYSLGYDVHVTTAQDVNALVTRDKELIIISSSVKDCSLGDRLCDVATPIIASYKELYVSLRMSGTHDDGAAAGHNKIDINYP